MHIRYTAENIIFAIQEYENWTEVIKLILKRQAFTKVILKNGMQIEAGKSLKWLMHEIFFRKVYNPVNLPIEENDIVVDVGAHYGIFTLYAASISKNTIYAFEPSPSNFECLLRNIYVNGLNNVTASNFALSDKIGSTKLLVNPSDTEGHLLFDHLIPEKLDKYRTSAGHQFDHLIPKADTLEKYVEVEVPTTTLQDVIDSNNLERIDFLKMDCEGSEGAILHSTPREYLKRVRKIAVEFHDHLSQFNHNDIQIVLEEIGFSIKLKWDNKSPLGYLYAWRN